MLDKARKIAEYVRLLYGKSSKCAVLKSGKVKSYRNIDTVGLNVLQLDLQYNCIIFEDTTSKDALEQCSSLPNRCRTLREVKI